MSEQTSASVPEDPLAQLTGPWVVPPTETQKQREDGILAGELLWKRTLTSFYRHTESQFQGLYYENPNDAYTDAEDLEDYTDSEDDPANGPFRFLDLPPEIRVYVYEFVLLHEEVERKERKREAVYREHIQSSRPTYPWKPMSAGYDRRRRTSYIPLKSRTEEQIARATRRQKLLNHLSTKRLERAARCNELIPGAEESYQQCKAEHETYTQRCWHEKNHKKVVEESYEDNDDDDDDEDEGEENEDEKDEDDEDEDEEDEDEEEKDDIPNRSKQNLQCRPPVYINTRGNLCDDLPMLALTCRLVLSEMWSIIYPGKTDPPSSKTDPPSNKTDPPSSKTDPPSSKTGKPSSKTVNPTRYKATIRNLNFFPLFRFLQTLNRPPYVAHTIDPATIDIRFDTKYRAKDELLHRNTFQHVKSLIELHWLRDFPLWSCIPGLSPQTDAPQNPFTEYMYRVRQIVKLFYVDRPTWKALTATCIHRADVVEQDKTVTETYWLTQSDSVIVEAAIETLAKAIEYRLGYEVNWLAIRRDGSEWHEKHMRMFMYRGEEEEVAYEKEHSVVYVIGRYCEDVDEVLRRRLKEGYGKWERE